MSSCQIEATICYYCELSWLSDFGISIVQRKGPLLVAAASRHTLWTPWRIHLVLRPKGQSFNSVLWCLMCLLHCNYITTILLGKLVKNMGWSNITSLRHGSQVGRVAKPQHSPFPPRLEALHAHKWNAESISSSILLRAQHTPQGHHCLSRAFHWHPYLPCAPVAPSASTREVSEETALVAWMEPSRLLSLRV